MNRSLFISIFLATNFFSSSIFAEAPLLKNPVNSLRNQRLAFHCRAVSADYFGGPAPELYFTLRGHDYEKVGASFQLLLSIEDVTVSQGQSQQVYRPKNAYGSYRRDDQGFATLQGYTKFDLPLPRHEKSTSYRIIHRGELIIRWDQLTSVTIASFKEKTIHEPLTIPSPSNPWPRALPQFTNMDEIFVCDPKF